MIRVFLVDDHALLRHTLRTFLSQQSTLQVVGEAAHGQQLLDQLPTTPCDVVLLDLHLPELDGLATTQRLQAEFPTVRILVLSLNDNELFISQVMAAGAHGYVLKSAGHDEIVVALHAVAAGRRFLCSELGLSLLDRLLVGSVTTTALPTSTLSAREQEVLRLVIEGLSTAQIAEKLFTSPRTVETHRQNILKKNCG